MTFPTEMFKEEFYRLVRSEEEHKAMLEDGWVDKRPEGHPYLPISAKDHPPILHDKEPIIKPSAKPPVPDVAMFAETKRGPGRPPNPKPENT